MHQRVHNNSFFFFCTHIFFFQFKGLTSVYLIFSMQPNRIFMQMYAARPPLSMHYRGDKNKFSWFLMRLPPIAHGVRWPSLGDVSPGHPMVSTIFSCDSSSICRHVGPSVCHSIPNTFQSACWRCFRCWSRRLAWATCGAMVSGSWFSVYHPVLTQLKLKLKGQKFAAAYGLLYKFASFF